MDIYLDAAPHWRQGGHKTTLTWEKIIIIYNFLFFIFYPLKKFVTTLCFPRTNIIKLWTKFGNKFDCKLKLQLHSIFFF